jgi:hypothetical protein
MVTLGMHGSQDRVAISSCEGLVERFFSAPDLARMVRNIDLPDYERNTKNTSLTIFLFYSCYTGQGDNSFAEQFSWEIQGITIAPQGDLFVSNKNHTIRNVKSKTDNSPQSWNVFYRGRMVTRFDNTIPNDWINSMGGIEKATEKIIEMDNRSHPWE